MRPVSEVGVRIGVQTLAQAALERHALDPVWQEVRKRPDSRRWMKFAAWLLRDGLDVEAVRIAVLNAVEQAKELRSEFALYARGGEARRNAVNEAVKREEMRWGARR